MFCSVRKVLPGLIVWLSVLVLTEPAWSSDTTAVKQSTQAIYVLKNPDGANKVGVFIQNAYDGSLTYSGEYDTGGIGDKTINGNQAHALLVRGNYLFVSNAGDDSISVFRIGVRGLLTSLGRFYSGGDRPVSMALKGNRLIVLNQGHNSTKASVPGTSGNLSVFKIITAGVLKLMTEARYDFAPKDIPVDVLSSSDDGFISVARFGANAIDNFWLDSDNGHIVKTDTLAGVQAPLGGAINPVQGQPFFTLSEQPLPGVITLKVDGAGKNVSQYQDIDPTLEDPCWATLHPDGRWLWLSSFKTRALSLYKRVRKGVIKPVSSYVPVAAGGGGLDVEVDARGQYLYRLRAAAVTGKTAPAPILDAFRIELQNTTAGLQWVGSATLPDDWADGSTTGIAIARVRLR